MTGYDIFKRVCSLLGYEDFNALDSKSTAFCEMLNQIAEDLSIAEIKSLSDDIPVNPRCREALIYGSAMLLAVSIGDSGCAKMYSELYNNKRSKALSSKEARQDVLPKPLNGGI